MIITWAPAQFRVCSTASDIALGVCAATSVSLPVDPVALPLAVACAAVFLASLVEGFTQLALPLELGGARLVFRNVDGNRAPAAGHVDTKLAPKHGHVDRNQAPTTGHIETHAARTRYHVKTKCGSAWATCDSTWPTFVSTCRPFVVV